MDVDKLDAPKSNMVELDRVLLIGDSDKVTTGTPTVEGAKVVATSLGEIRDKKITVFKFKSKIRYAVKKGHRQLHTRLIIDKIIGPEAQSEVTESGS